MILLLVCELEALTSSVTAQILAHDDAAAYYTAGGVWTSGMNFGFGFLPWSINTSQGAFIGDGGNIATISNSAWGLNVTGDNSGNPVAVRGFSNAIPVGESFKLQWRTDDIGNNGYDFSYSINNNNFAGFSLRSGNAGSSSTNYLTGERFALYYKGGTGDGSAKDDVRIRDGFGDNYAPAPGITFSNIHSGIDLEFTLLSSNTYRLVVADAATANVLAAFDNRTLAGSGSIQSVALYGSVIGGDEHGRTQLFNRMEISPPAIAVPAAVVVTPPAVAVPYGSSATFTANVIGTPPLSYQWLFDGTNLTGASGTSLTITNAQAQDTGNYQVVVTNLYGAATSAVATLTAGAPPTISGPPQDLSVALGTQATFSVVAGGDSPLNYQWRFGGANLSGATSPTLVIPAAFLANAGNYDIVVTNIFGAATSSVATLAVYTPPSILQQPADAQVAVGDSTTFRVVGFSSAPLSYQWFLNETNIAGATSSTYTVSHAQLTDSGVYNVAVITPAGSIVSSNATLTVVVPPPPPPPLPSYTVAVQPGLNLIANQLNQGANRLNEILPVVPDGTVASKYDNVDGVWLQSTYSAMLGGWVPGNITLSPGEGAFLNSPTNFDLTFTGTPQVPVLPVTIPDGAAYLLSRQTNDVGTYENITGTSPSSGAAVYQWVNSNDTYAAYTYSDSGWSGGVEPTAAVGEALWIAPTGGTPTPLPDAPSITNEPAGVTAGLGGTAVFAVGATGGQPLVYQWLLNNNQLSGATNITLILTNLQPTNAGSYSVVVKNSIGVADSTAVSLTLSNVTFLPFEDDFGSAGDLGSATNGSGFGSNVGATVEPGEPGPPNLPLGASVWVKWEPQASGVASFNTVGSGFDTMLAVFTGSNLTTLTLVASDDDGAPFLCSALSFNVVGGTTYFIQVSGFSGAMGSIELSWNEVVTAPAPVILSPPVSQTVPPGTNVTLSVGVQGSGPFAYQWFLNSVALSGQTNASLTLSNIDVSQVGYYTVQVTDPQTLESTTSDAAHVMLADVGPGFTGNSAFISGQDKFQNATALTPPDPNVAHDPAPCGGFTGAISDDNALATAQVGEPNHCGYPPCHSIWYSYVSPASGPVTLRLYGNNFNAVLGVYAGPGNSFATLVPVACSANHGSTGESVTYTTSAGTTNWIVVDGVNCASGTYSLSWTVAASPTISVQPISQTLSTGSSLTLAAAANGAPTLGYQWRLNGNNLPGASGSSYVVSSFQNTNAGNYTLVVTNSYGSVTSLTATASVAAGIPVTIGTTVSPASDGYVVGAGSYSAGQNVTLTAVPNACYSLVNWTDASGSIVSTSPSFTLTASVNRSLTANFAFNTYAISASGSPVAGGSISGGGTYNCGGNVTVTATPNFGYQFTGWTEGIVEVSTNPAYNFSASANRTLLANFSPIVTLFANPTNGGAVAYSVVATRVTISAQPNPGWRFTTWSDGFPLNPRNISASAGAVYIANFVPASIALGFGSPPFNPSGFNLILTGPVGTAYRIDVSSDMLNWTPLTSFTTSNSPAFFSDPTVTGQTQRFYRAVWPSP